MLQTKSGLFVAFCVQLRHPVRKCSSFNIAVQKNCIKTTIPQGVTFYLFIPFICSISACICVICGKPHDPQMTQIHADGKQGTNVRTRRFQTRIRMSERSKIRLTGGTSFSSLRRGVLRTLSRKNRCLFTQHGFLQAAIWTAMFLQIDTAAEVVKSSIAFIMVEPLMSGKSLWPSRPMQRGAEALEMRPVERGYRIGA